MVDICRNSFLAVALRVFVVSLYQISSVSMEPVLLSGDVIIVSKTSYGPRLLKLSSYQKNKNAEYCRLKGRRGIKKVILLFLTCHCIIVHLNLIISILLVVLRNGSFASRGILC